MYTEYTVTMKRDKGNHNTDMVVVYYADGSAKFQKTYVEKDYPMAMDSIADWCNAGTEPSW